MATENTKQDDGFFDKMTAITQVDWFQDFGMISTWQNKYSVWYSLILTRFGLCYNFNMVNSSKLLKIEKTSKDFHYKADQNTLAYIRAMGSNTLELNQSFPWTASNSRRHLIVDFYEKNYQSGNPLNEKRGYHLIFHSNFEFPFLDEKNHIFVDPENFMTVDIVPVVFKADDTLTDLNPNE